MENGANSGLQDHAPSEVVVVTDVQVHVEGFAVAVPVRREDVLVEGPVHTDGCRMDRTTSSFKPLKPKMLPPLF